jgi:acyl carrier protein
MNETPTTDRLAVLIGRVCDIPPGIVDRHARLLGFGLDSVRITELIVLIEEEFAVVLRMQDLTGVQTVEDLARRIEHAAASSVRQQVGPTKES